MKKKRIHNYLRVSYVVLCLVFTIVLSVRVVSADSPEDMTHKEVHDPGVSLKLCYQIESSYNRNYCINVKSNSSHNGTNIQLFNADRTSACQWVYKPVKWDSSYKHLYYMIYNYNSGKVLDVKNGRASNGSNIQLYQWNGSNAQLWEICANSDGTVTFLSALDRSYALDLSQGKVRNSQNVQLFKVNGTRAQKWYIAARSIDDGCDYVRYGEKKTFTLKAGRSNKYFTNLTCKLTYKSSDPSVATVNQNGIVTAKKRGKAVITVYNYHQSASLEVKVI